MICECPLRRRPIPARVWMAASLLYCSLNNQNSSILNSLNILNRHPKVGHKTRDLILHSPSLETFIVSAEGTVDYIPLSEQTLNWVKNSNISLLGLPRCQIWSITRCLCVTVSVQVFVSDSRINVYIDVDTWVLVLYKVVPADEATYECHVNADPPQKVSIHLFVKGKQKPSVFSVFILSDRLDCLSNQIPEIIDHTSPQYQLSKIHWTTAKGINRCRWKSNRTFITLFMILNMDGKKSNKYFMEKHSYINYLRSPKGDNFYF